MSFAIKPPSARSVVRFVVAKTVHGIVVTIINQNVPVETKVQKTERFIGAYILGSMVGEAASNYVSEKMDDAFGTEGGVEIIDVTPEEITS